MRYIQLKDDEKQILEDFSQEEFIEVGNVKEERRRYKEYTKNTLNKTKNINIRLSIKDLQRLKAQAIESGLPYQTLVSAVLHNFANKKIRLSF
jgi:predicted DNA binding CopG/RHH family protein